MSKTVKWGILSTARIADQLVRAIRMSSNNELVAVASRDLGRATAWAQERQVPHAFGSYEEMLASDAIDAVYIPLPNSMHKPWTIRAAEMGKHVLCEKPLAEDAAGAEAMRAAALKHDVKLMEAFMYQFHPQYKIVRKMQDDGTIGDLRIIRASFGFYLDRPGDIRLNKELAGGSLLDVGCYCVNVSRLLTGAEPTAVQGSAVWGPSGVDESFVGILEFPDGVLAAIDSSFRHAGHQWVGLSGTRAHVGIVEPFRMEQEPTAILYDHDGESERLFAPGANEYHQMVEHFADVLLNGRPLAYPPENSLKQMRVIDALLESARTHKRVQLT